MRALSIILMGLFLLTASSFACENDVDLPAHKTPPSPGESFTTSSQYPKIASWLSKKDEIIDSGKPFDLVTAAFFMPDEAKEIRKNNPDALLLAGLTANWIWANEGWMTTLTTFASYGSDKNYEITDNMYLRKPNGERCPFGWASESWGQEEIYAMDPRNPGWVDLVVAFYQMVLDQPQHDGIIVDMVVEKQWWCPEAISDGEWLEATREIFRRIDEINTDNKLVLFNSGKNFADIDEYAEFMDGYFMENFMGDFLKATYEEGLQAAGDDFIVIYAVDTDDTGIKDLEKMRLGLTLSLLNDNTYFAYDFGPRDHGQAWWFPEYDADLGDPLGAYYEKDNAYWREFEKGTVVSSPNTDVAATFDAVHTDVTTGEQSQTFEVSQGDGRIFIKSSA